MNEDHARVMLRELLEKEDGLQPWEVEFVESLSKWEGDLTDKQKNALAKVWDRVFD